MQNKSGMVILKAEMEKIPMRHSSIILKYNDKKATETITDDLEEYSWTDVANGEADTLSITLNNKSKKWIKGFYPSSRDYIKMWIKVSGWNNFSDNRKSFCGRFQIDEFTCSGFPSVATLSGLSIPIHTGFNVTQRNRTYKKKTVKTILSEIAKRSDLKLVYDAKDYKVDEISQGGSTDMNFAFSLCSDYGISLKVYNQKLVAYDQTRYEKKKSSYKIDYSDLTSSGAFSFRKSTANMYDGVKFQYSNKDGKDVTYKYIVPGKKGSRLLFINSSADSHADAEHKAKSQLLSNLRSAQQLDLQLMGDPKYKACQCFTLTGFGKLNGKYFIDRVTHTKNSGYYVNIQAHPVVTNIS